MVISEKINLQTKGHGDMINITPQVSKAIVAARLADGITTLFISGSTAGLTTIEFESGLITDFTMMWDRMIPKNIHYHHDSAWGDGNGHSHIRASLLGPSVTIPFSNHQLNLGTWQQIILVDFDNRPRQREVIIQIIGE